MGQVLEMNVFHQFQNVPTPPASKWLIAAAASAALLLTGCGSGTNAEKNKLLTRQVLGSLKLGKKAAPPRVTNEQIAQIMAGTTQPLVLVDITKNKTSAVVLEIGRNGVVQTYATAARQTISLQNGLARGTRGLGGDLMSADLGQLPALISGKSSGASSREMRFLNGEDVTVRYKFNCSVATSKISSKPAAYSVTESCTQSNGSTNITNTYQVDGAGRVQSSCQWFGPTLDYIKLQQLRH